MSSVRMHRQSRPRTSGGSGPTGAPVYWGWSHANQRMEMMDLPSYLDSFRMGYEQALSDLQQRMQAMASSMVPGSGATTPPMPQAWGTGWTGAAPAPWGAPGRHGHRHHHGHHGHHRDCGCEEHREHDCGCRDFDCDDDDCRCECCIDDADIVIYARCGETRVIPIEIDNDSRRERDNVTLELSDVRSSGGRKLDWPARLDQQGPLTLEPCSRTKLELLVHVACEDPNPPTNTEDSPAAGGKRAAKDAPVKSLPSDTAEEAVRTRLLTDIRSTGNVDRCEVGYVTLRLGGCLVRPIVVAIAVLPNECGSFRTGCQCSCCC